MPQPPLLQASKHSYSTRSKMSSKSICPHCSKSFMNVNLHITKAHDSWVAEAKTEMKTVRGETKKVIVGWTLTKNDEFVCELNSCWGTTSWGKDGCVYADYHQEDSDTGKYILLEDFEGDQAKTKIVYAHYKGQAFAGLSKTVVCDNLVVIY